MTFVVKDPDTDEVKSTQLRYKVTSVFDISQTKKRDDLTARERMTAEQRWTELDLILREELEQLADSEAERLADVFESYLKDLNISITAYPFSPPKGGDTDGKVIRYRKGISKIHKFLILLHEYAHYRLHFIRDPKTNELELDPEYSREKKELEAETVLYLVAKVFGLTDRIKEVEEYAVFYMAAWQNKEDIVDALQDVHALVREISQILGEESEVDDSKGD
jgi:hypothetical protein